MEAPSNYPEPIKTFMLDVGDGHKIYAEESGNPNGIPLINFHGGPGSRSKPKHRTYYDLNKFRLILFDQRNSGNSTPLAINDPASLKHNSANLIVSDAEKIRQHIGIDKWHVTGASWGSALALRYAITYPECTSSLTLRALFLAQNADWGWMAEGARILYPPAHQKLKNLFPKLDGLDLIKAVAERILCSPRTEALNIFKALVEMEHALEILKTPEIEQTPQEPKPEEEILNMGLLYAHMIKHNDFNDNWCFTNKASQALENMNVSIVHGACDASCPLKNVYALKDAYSDIQLAIANNAGHGVDLNGDYEKLYQEALSRLS